MKKKLALLLLVIIFKCHCVAGQSATSYNDILGPDKYLGEVIALWEKYERIKDSLSKHFVKRDSMLNKRYGSEGVSGYFIGLHLSEACNILRKFLDVKRVPSVSCFNDRRNNHIEYSIDFETNEEPSKYGSVKWSVKAK
ncbi:MAG: hypothetical protein H7296_09290 [Bacteroidia bacterium]|nr:hypothetical protein [Bacteroidia bacterium]